MVKNQSELPSAQPELAPTTDNETFLALWVTKALMVQSSNPDMTPSHIYGQADIALELLLDREERNQRQIVIAGRAKLAGRVLLDYLSN